MASEFKIGRLRYTWTGPWSTTTQYAQDAVTQFDGKMYVCLIAHTSNSTDFYADLYAVPFSYWQLVLDGKKFAGPWTTATKYNLGNIVLWAGKAYYCSTKHTSTAFATDVGYWTVYTESLNWNNSWAINTVYGLNDIVKYGGIVYKCTANHTSAATITLGLEADQSSWTIVNKGIEFKGVWAVGIRYKSGDLVRNGADLYLTNMGHTSTGVFDMTKWALFMPGQENVGTWDAGLTYQLGDVVSYGGYNYQCITSNTVYDPTANTNAGNPPSVDSTDWLLLNMTYRLAGTWDGATKYKVGEVVNKHGVVFVAIADNQGRDPTAFNVSGSYTAAGSSGATLVLASTSGLAVGMIASGVGITAGQTISKIIDSTTILLSRAPDGALVDGQVISFIGLNYLYWNISTPGTSWYSTWTKNIAYSVGDIVVWQNTTYICIQNNTSSYSITNGIAAGNRPDSDTTYQYWIYYVPHARKNALNTLGDIETYDSNAYTAIPVGTTTFTLQVDSTKPAWKHINSVPAVYYVSSSNGQDLNTEGWGATWDKPWKTISFACSVVAQGKYYPYATAIINANRRWLIQEVYQWMLYQISTNTAPFTSSVSLSASKTQRDTGYVIDALVYDMQRGGNSQIVAATLAYFAFGGTTQLFNSAVSSQISYYVALLNKLSTLITNNVIPQIIPGTNYQTLTSFTPQVTQVTGLTPAEPSNMMTGDVGAQNTATSLLSILTSVLTAQDASLLPAQNTGCTATIFVKTGTYLEPLPITVPENVAINGDELRGVTVEPLVSIKTKATATSASSGLITVTSTTGMADQMPVQFVDPDIATAIVYTAFGGLTAGKTYWIIGTTLTSTQFAVALSPTVTFTGSTSNGSAVITDVSNFYGLVVGATISGAGIPLLTTILNIGTTTITLSKVAISTRINIPLQSTGATAVLTDYIGGNMTVYAGDCLKDMFRLRNGTGLRNMTVLGLKGTLTAQDEFFLQRPTGGSYACLDPGQGPRDTQAWIFRRSPYVQNVTAFGDGVAGLKIDGTLHNGGNKSIVCNDFTHIISDGIGIWCTGPGALTEAVSVFSYYGYTGYFADAGGRIRATNGNTSYGAYGVISSGYDITETPATGIIFNQSSQVQATIQQSYGSNSQLLRLQYNNAGSGYYTTTTNLVNYSNNFVGASWASDGYVVFSKVAVAPSGLTEAWTISGLNASLNSSYFYQNINVPQSGGLFSNVTALNVSGNGNGAVFNITVTSTAYTVQIVNQGTGYAVTNQVYVPGGQLGGVNNVNDCIITINGLTGSGIQQVSVSGTVPSGSAYNYTQSIFIKQGTATSVDIDAIYSGSSTVTSSINYNFLTGVVTPSKSGGGFLPTQYGAINQQLSSTDSTTGWIRLWFAVNDTTGLNTQLQFRVYPKGKTGAINQYTYFYGSQVEISPATYTPSFYLEVSTVSKYTAYANYNVSGAGTAAIIVGDELRSRSVFNTRITTDSLGVTGGAGFLTASNNAQAGTPLSVQLAQSDVNTNSNYTGMRVVINSGTGAGQYGYISYYNSTSKNAYVLKESFDILNVTSTTAAGSSINLATNVVTDTLYQNMPVQFIPTYYTTGIISTSLSQTLVTATVGGIVDTMTVASTQGFYINMPVFFTATGSQSIFTSVSQGYNYYISAILDSTTIQLTDAPYGAVWNLNSGTGAFSLNFPANNSYLQGGTTNMVVNYPVQFTGTALGGVTVGTTYYILDVIDNFNFTISGSLQTITVTATNSGTNTLTTSTTAGLLPLNPIVFSAPVIDTIQAEFKYYISSIVNATSFRISSSILRVTATATAPVSNLITVTDTTGFVPNNPIKFVGTSFGGIESEKVYYISVVNDSTTFTISQTPGASAITLASATGLMTASTCPADYTMNGASGTMVGTTCTSKTSLSLGSGTMNATFSTSLFGGVELGRTYYINSLSSNTFTVSLVSGSGSAISVTTKTGSMNVAAAGWDHINPGTQILNTLDNSSVYYIEPRTVYSKPQFSQASVSSGNSVGLASGTYWQAMAYGNGLWVAIPSGNSTGAYSTTGNSWTALNLPTTASWTDIDYGNNYWVIINSGTATSYVSKSNGAGWTAATLPINTSWSNLAYGNGVFVAIATGTTNSAYSTNYGFTWSAGSSLPNQAWSAITYGAGKFVAVASGTNVAAYSRDGGVNWISITLPSNTSWNGIAYGNNMFVVVSNTSNTTAYSTDAVNWYSSNLPIMADRVVYGQGVFLALSANNTQAYTSEDGVTWTSRSVSADAYGAVAFGFATGTNVGAFATLSATNKATSIAAGARTKGRALVTSGIITGINEFEPGSNYTSPPTITFTDPNVTTLATVEPRISNGVLGSPTFINRGSGYNTASTSVKITGNGFADTYQTGLQIVLNNLTRLPSPGDNLVIAGVSQVFKVTSAYSVYNTSAPNLEANVSVSPSVSTANATANGTQVSIRSLYSQARLTGHDFLNIGYGDFETSNYPGFPDAGYSAVQNNQTVETNYGRVFYTSTDQDGNFKVGSLFGVQQATGIITLSASQFGLTGLSSLSLGGISVGGSSVQITQFSTDQSFTANSDSILPTQKSIKAYLTSRLSQGGSNTFTGQLIAGTVIVGGAYYIKSSVPNGVTGSRVKMASKVYVNSSGVGGNMAALDFFMQHAGHKSIRQT
jgi:hypothetical protein